MYRLIRSTPIFIALYLLFLVPTYVLPYFGSNSSIGTLIGGAVAGWGGMFPPQWWAHMFVLGVLVVVAWTRGMLLQNKAYLPIVAFLAAIFDMAPILRAIPLVPTALHVTTIVLGIVKVEFKDEQPLDSPLWRQPAGILGALTFVAVIGSVWSSMAVHSSLSSPTKRPFNGISVSPKLETKKDTPAPAPVATPGQERTPATNQHANEIPAPAVSAVVPQSDGTPEARVEKRGNQEPQHATLDQKGHAGEAGVAESKTVGILLDGQQCLKKKQYECAERKAQEALRIEPKNSAARTLLSKAQSGQRAALDKIEIQ